ncbi:MAG: NUDIX hydrolase, partial [Acidimicrobiales bacterium]
HDHAWLTPTEVLERRALGEVDLAAPTFVTLSDLAQLRDVDAALTAAAGRRPVPRYATHWVPMAAGAVALWEGDAGYETHDPNMTGPRHRLWMDQDGWRYERT